MALDIGLTSVAASEARSKDLRSFGAMELIVVPGWSQLVDQRRNWLKRGTKNDGLRPLRLWKFRDPAGNS